MSELPRGWTTAPLGTFLNAIETGKSFKCEERPPTDGEIGVVKVSAVTWGEYDESQSKTCLEPSRDNPSIYVRPGDFLFSRANTIDLVGACVIAKHVTKPVMLSDKILRFRLQHMSPGWLLHYLRSESGRKQLQDASSGNQLSMRNIAQARIGELAIPVPPLNEQERIQAKLEALQARSRAARTALDEVPELLEKLRQSILAAAFRGDLTKDWRAKNPDVEPAEKLLQRIRAERRKKWEEAELAKMLAKGKPPTDDRWKEKYADPAPVDATGLPELPVGWCWAAWREIGFSQNGRAFPSAEYCESGTRLLRPGNLAVSGLLEWTPENTRCMPHQWASDYPDFIVRANQLVMNLTAQSLKDEFLGRVCMTGPGERCLLNQRLARLTPVALPAKYWLCFFKSPLFRRYVDTLNTGSLIQHMFTSQVDACAVPLMPAEEANALSELVDRYMGLVHRTVPLVHQETRRLQDMEQALLSKAFRGELVPQDPGDEPADVMLARLKAPAPSPPDTSATPSPSRKAQRPPPQALSHLRSCSRPGPTPPSARGPHTTAMDGPAMTARGARHISRMSTLFHGSGRILGRARPQEHGQAFEYIQISGDSRAGPWRAMQKTPELSSPRWHRLQAAAAHLAPRRPHLARARTPLAARGSACSMKCVGSPGERSPAPEGTIPAAQEQRR